MTAVCFFWPLCRRPELPSEESSLIPALEVDSKTIGWTVEHHIPSTAG